MTMHDNVNKFTAKNVRHFLFQTSITGMFIYQVKMNTLKPVKTNSINTAIDVLMKKSLKTSLLCKISPFVECPT